MSTWAPIRFTLRTGPPSSASTRSARSATSTSRSPPPATPALHLATLAGALPGMPGLLTAYMERKMGEHDIPPIPEFIEMIADTGAGLYGCQVSCDLFGLGKDDLIEQVTGIITVGEF